MQRRTLIKAAALATGAIAAPGSFAAPAYTLEDEEAWVPARKVPTCVVGCGRQGRAILAELASLSGGAAAEVVAICDPVASRKRGGQRKAPGAAVFDDLTAALTAHPEIEAVVVATPSHLHAPVAIEALDRSLAVYVEAPLATTEEDLTAILEAEGQSFGRLHVGLQGRSNPLYAHARNFYRSGAIRDLVGMSAGHREKKSWYAPSQDPTFYDALNWRTNPEVSLGLAGEWAVHQLDVVHWFTGQYPTAVRGSGSTQLHDDEDVFDTVQLEFEFEGGRRLMWDGTRANSFGKRTEVFRGTAGTIRLAQDAGWLFKESDAPTLGFEVYAGREHFHDEEGITLVVDATKLAAQERLKEGVGLRRTPLSFALEAFYLGILDGAAAPCSGAEAARAARVAMAACQAVRTGERVPIDVKA